LSEHKAIVLRSEAELWSKGNLDVADELYGADFICHFVGRTEWKGIKGLKSEVASVAGKIVEQWGFPDSQSLMQQLTAAATGKP
jgi:hypothetical protein